MTFVRIPKERLAVVIGQGGDTKEALERRSGIAIEVDTDENEVHIMDEAEGVDPLMALKMRDIVKAIGRGFSPEHAMRLFSDEAYLELLDIQDYVGKHKQHVRRVKARVIGKEGKTRRILEDQTGCYVSVYGHTVAIIGDLEHVGDCKQAVDMLLSGSEHASVYRFLENRKRAEKRARQDLW